MILEFINNYKHLLITKCTSEEYKKVQEITKAKEWRYGGKYESVSMLDSYTLPAGLWHNLLMLKKDGFIVKITNYTSFLNSIDEDTFSKYIESLNLNFVPYKYQFDSAYRLLKYPISQVELAPGAGKTLMCYILSNYYLDNMLGKGKKVLIIVPKVILVTQTAKNFEGGYTKEQKLICDTVYAKGKEKENSNVVIGCTNSLVKKPVEYFKQFGAVIVDEAHKVTTTSIQKIFKKLPKDIKSINGCTGTMPESDIGVLLSKSYLGPTVYTKSQRELIDEDQSICDLKVRIIHMKVPKERSEWYYSDELSHSNDTKFRFEVDNIWKVENTKDTVCKVINKYDGNHLLGFSTVALLHQFAEFIKDKFPDRVVHIIHGDHADYKGVKEKKREEIINDIESADGRILLATYQTIDTGVDLHRISHLHMIEGTKSFYRIRQYIGRGSRLHNTKMYLNVYDYCIHLERDPSWKGPYINVFGKQYKERVTIYNQQKYEYKHFWINI